VQGATIHGEQGTESKLRSSRAGPNEVLVDEHTYERYVEGYTRTIRAIMLLSEYKFGAIGRRTRCNRGNPYSGSSRSNRVIDVMGDWRTTKYCIAYGRKRPNIGVLYLTTHEERVDDQWSNPVSMTHAPDNWPSL
jgi:hypothetical protein